VALIDIYRDAFTPPTHLSWIRADYGKPNTIETLINQAHGQRALADKMYFRAEQKGLNTDAEVKLYTEDVENLQARIARYEQITIDILIGQLTDETLLAMGYVQVNEHSELHVIQSEWWPFIEADFKECTARYGNTEFRKIRIQYYKISNTKKTNRKRKKVPECETASTEITEESACSGQQQNLKRKNRFRIEAEKERERQIKKGGTEPNAQKIWDALKARMGADEVIVDVSEDGAIIYWETKRGKIADLNYDSFKNLLTRIRKDQPIEQLVSEFESKN
jgi:hypothetical protein